MINRKETIMNKNQKANCPAINTHQDNNDDVLPSAEQSRSELHDIMHGELWDCVNEATDNFCEKNSITYSVIRVVDPPLGGHLKLKIGCETKFTTFGCLYYVNLNTDFPTGGNAIIVAAEEHNIEVAGVGASSFAELLKREIVSKGLPWLESNITYTNLTPDGSEYDRLDGEKFYRK